MKPEPLDCRAAWSSSTTRSFQPHRRGGRVQRTVTHRRDADHVARCADPRGESGRIACLALRRAVL